MNKRLTAGASASLLKLHLVNGAARHALTTQGFERTKDKARHGAGLLVDGSLGGEHPRESFS